ncbi:MAG: ATP-binding protein, partial [Lentisphaerota bacterium]
LDAEDRTVFVNPKMAAMLDVTEAEIKGLTPFPFIAEIHHDRARFNLSRGREGSCGQIDLELVSHKGRRRLAQFSTAPILNDQGRYEGALAIVMDITEQRNLEREVQDIGDREKEKLGRELHDGLGQLLTGIELKIKTLEGVLKSRSIPEAGDAGEISALVREAASQSKNLAKTLYPASLDRYGLSVSLRHLADYVTRHMNVPCQYTESGLYRVKDRILSLHLYRIVQEAVHNAVRHAQASKIDIVFELMPQKGLLTIRDNGRGMTVGPSATHGMGCHIMQYRARLLQGTIEWKPAPEGGVLVECAFPLKLESSSLKVV